MKHQVLSSSQHAGHSTGPAFDTGVARGLGRRRPDSSQRRAALLPLLILGLPGCAFAVEPGCPVVNLMQSTWRVIDAARSQASEATVREFRKALVVPHEDLYGKNGLGFDSTPELDAAILQALSDSRRHERELKATARRIEQRLPPLVESFKATFRDFRCDFPIYIMHALHRLDGAGRMVDGRPSLVLGVDMISDEKPESFDILIHHELFHRYHFQVAGFSDDNADREVLWRGLWVEGLATYVSMRLNPPASLQTALIAPEDLVERAQPMLADLVAELTPHLDEIDPERFRRFFTYRGPEAVPPSRAGYYIGALIAERLAKRHSLSTLAHMSADSVREELGTQLAALP